MPPARPGGLVFHFARVSPRSVERHHAILLPWRRGDLEVLTGAFTLGIRNPPKKEPKSVLGGGLNSPPPSDHVASPERGVTLLGFAAS